MRNICLNTLMALLLCVGASADIASNFYFAGNELETINDPVTGRQIKYLTGSDYADTSFYPHQRGWSACGNYLFAESVRPRPDGSPSTGNGSDYRNIERQLLAINVNNGDIYWLASIEVEEDTSQYGVNQLGMSSQFHADYAPETNMIVFYDMTGHRLYTLNLNNGEKQLIWTFEYATLGDPPSISWDGQTVIVFATSARPSDSSFFSGRTTSIFKLNINPQTGQMTGKPSLVYSYSNRVNPTNDGDINLGHAVIDPMDSSQMTFCHGYSGSADGSVQKRRVWYAKTDGSEIRSLTNTTHIDTHEIWGFSSLYGYFVRIQGANRSLQQLNISNGELETIFASDTLNITHMSTDFSENLFVFDTFDSVIDAHNRNSAVYLYNKQNDALTQLSSLPTGINHPRHSHPILSPDGSMAAFVVGVVGTADSRIALMEISE
jgi:hypothetical protein